MRKKPYTNRKFENQWTQNTTKTSIKQRSRTNLGRSVGVTTVIQLVWLNQFTGTSLPTNLKGRLIKRTQNKSKSNQNNPQIKSKQIHDTTNFRKKTLN